MCNQLETKGLTSWKVITRSAFLPFVNLISKYVNTIELVCVPLATAKQSMELYG